MSAITEASVHLSKAKEFLSIADLALKSGKPNAAASNVVLAGINAKDTICLLSTGRSGKSDDHKSAISELQSTGPIGRSQSQRFQRLLTLKNDAQYLAVDISLTRATKGVEWATFLVAAAQDAVQSF